MKNYIIVFLIVCLIVSFGFNYRIYKENKAVLHQFPKQLLTGGQKIEAPVYLFLFFSKYTCRDCMNSFEFLNRMGPPFVVTGITPDEELKDEKSLRESTGITFKLDRYSRYEKYLPFYGPSLMGVTAKGRILFLFPGLPEQAQWLKSYLEAFYIRAYRILMI